MGGKFRAAATAALVSAIVGYQLPAIAGSISSADTYSADYTGLVTPVGSVVYWNYSSFTHDGSADFTPDNFLVKLTGALHGIGAPVSALSLNPSANITAVANIERISYVATDFGSGHPLVLEAASVQSAFTAANLGPAGSLSSTGAISSKSGQGDTVLFGTIGVIVDPQNQRFLGLSDYNYIPTGVFDKAAVANLYTAGQYNNVVQIGYSEGLTKFGLNNLWFDFIPNTTFHSDGGSPAAVSVPGIGTLSYNRVTQDQSYDAKWFLRYAPAPGVWFAFGVEKSWGGTQYGSGGSLQSGATIPTGLPAPYPATTTVLALGKTTLGSDDYTKLHWEGHVPISRTSFLAVDISTETQVANGTKEDLGVEIRYTKAFLPEAPLK